MADGNGKPYYWESMDINTTGENVGIVLDSLCDIVADNDLPASGKDTVKWVPGTEGKKGYFELGDGGGIIPGNEDQLVAADGQGKAKANIGMFYSKYDSSNYHSILQSPTPFVTFKSTSNTTENYWGYSHPLTLNMEYAPLLQFLGRANSGNNGSPVLSMRGPGIIDVESGNRVYGTDSRSFFDSGLVSYNSKFIYQETLSPLVSGQKMYNDNLIYPYLSFKQSATLMMTDMSIIQAMGGSSLTMDGNIDIRLRGSGVKHGSDYLNFGTTQFWVEPGSIFRMATDETTPSYPNTGPSVPTGTTRPLFSMWASSPINSQIIMTTASPITTKENPVSTLWDDFIYVNKGFTSMNCGWHGVKSVWVREKAEAYSYDWSSNIDDITQPTFLLQGQSNITIGGNGKFGCRVCVDYGAKTMFAVQNYGGSTVGVKLGADGGAEGEWEILQGADSQQFIKFGAAPGAKLDIAFEPHGINSLKFAPVSTCGISFTPQNTDLCCQWTTMDAVIDCTDSFIDCDGLNRIELRDEAIIHMKGSSHKADMVVLEYTASNSDSITIVTDTDYTGMTVQDFSEYDYKNFTKPLLEKSTFSANKWYYQRGGNIVSTEYYSERYRIVLEGFTRYQSGTSKSNCFVYWDPDRWTTSFSTMYNWPEFQEWLHAHFGPNATVTNGSIFNAYYASGSGYDMYWSGTVNNVQVSINSETQYEIGASFTDMSAEDQAKISDRLYGNRSNAVVVANDVRTDMRYNTTISNYTYTTGQQNGEDWSAPVQCRKNGPVFQLYDRANICMRNRYMGSSVNFTYVLDNITETYDFTQPQYDVITQFLNSADYTAFINEKLNGNPNLLSDILSLAEGDEDNPGTKLYIVYVPKSANKENYIINTGDDPILELTGPSELRIHNGATIKAETEYGRTTITFGGTEDEGEVSFTIDELRNLKRMISATPTVVVNDSSEMTENDTLYFLNE